MPGQQSLSLNVPLCLQALATPATEAMALLLPQQRVGKTMDRAINLPGSKLMLHHVTTVEVLPCEMATATFVTTVGTAWVAADQSGHPDIGSGRVSLTGLRNRIQ